MFWDCYQPADNTPMTQCELRQRREGNQVATRVAYIPTKFAVEGTFIRIRENKRWLPGEWEVVLCGETTSMEVVSRLHEAQKAFRYYEAKNKKKGRIK